MRGALRSAFQFLIHTFVSARAVFAATSDRSELHPLRDALPKAELTITIEAAEFARGETVLECAYRPRRESDVRKEHHFRLFGSMWGGSKDRLLTQRDDEHTTHRVATCRDGRVTCRVPLRAEEAGYEAYQLYRVRLGRIVFQRWTATEPALAAEFGLKTTPDTLRGTFREAGIAATPLGGSLPLWPGLRVIELRVAATDFPELRLWDDSTKHHWDGWRQSSPAYWKFGHDTVNARTDVPTVWWSHEVAPYPRSLDPARSEDNAGPSGVVGVALEIFWPKGAKLALPDTRFDREVEVAAFPLAALNERGRALLAEAATLRPGLELGSLTTTQWRELEALGADHDPQSAVALSMESDADGRKVLQLTRVKLDAPWVFVFAAPYDSEQRVAVQALVVHPTAWAGPRPE